MSKRLVDIDDSLLEAAQAELGTATIKATVNEALRRAGEGRTESTREALDVLATAAISDRDDAWRCPGDLGRPIPASQSISAPAPTCTRAISDQRPTPWALRTVARKGKDNAPADMRVLRE